MSNLYPPCSLSSFSIDPMFLLFHSILMFIGDSKGLFFRKVPYVIIKKSLLMFIIVGHLINFTGESCSCRYLSLPCNKFLLILSYRIH